ncbi:ABC transporter ATP-binding protein [Corynebacterium pygosceleis]|uniref:ABC transporter ATP-binding protein n=1 Tax=Corynebacterium pygosceleis TaxID=2800406 RepID=A0A9Q4GLA7_9CORY|nr:ABC transporter ATP-binding protein [Corynebacterium pygosceleis]MCK7637486.1 ABC transporter ATP-binding protein [Corynebacterium pygosceleis]MCK7674673.1 ABC transporter ATP-binding protein [Corynebacterium pygosceleis]MCL0119738.1 ABC transporter ATP-binding protein [Corynebacterium pygosceleis]MCX7444985.1 ABC transporter ATP-binding protein [Corynebacterium pygosceleis]MCX7468185.1 ABC transporter ATP-binding protein [Corynebacterium pygosceleis]
MELKNQVDGLCSAGVSVGYRDRPVLDGIDVEIPGSAVTTIIGPNGCGKSTLLKTFLRLLRPTTGHILLDGTDITRFSTRELARRMGLLPQSPTAPEGLRLRDLVALGRHPHHSWLNSWTPSDDAAVDRAMELTHTSELADHPVDSLSGGQRQRAWIAMTLAQETDLVLFDEPTTYLDLRHCIEVLDLIDTLCADHGRTVVMVLHDLALACRYSDHLIIMKEGRIAATGHPRDIISTDMLREVFGLEAAITQDPVSDRPLIIPIGKRRTCTSDRAVAP